MSARHRSHAKSQRQRTRAHKTGVHHAQPLRSEPYKWLGVSAVTLGLGAAMASGTGVAAAHTGTDTGASSTATSTSSSGGTSSSTPSGSKHHPKTGESSKKKATSATAVTAPTAPTLSHSTTTGTTSKGNHQAPPTAATATATTPSPAAAKPVAPVPAATTIKPVALAAVPVASTAASTTTTSTTLHATSTNPIIAAIQNAIISIVTSPSMLSWLTHEGLTGPTAPSSWMGSLLYGIYRGLENFAGLVPKAGAVTTTSDPTTSTVTGNLNVTVPAGDPSLVAYVATNPSKGTVTLHLDGTFTYTSNLTSAQIAALGPNPTDKFTVTVSDFVAAINVTVTVPISVASNAPSLPTATILSTNAITGVVTGTLNSTSPDGSNVTFAVTNNPTDNSVTLSGNTFTYTPTDVMRLAANVGTGATDSFTVTASNGQASRTATITVPVSPASNNTPSVPTATNITTASNGVVTGTLNSTSPDGSAVTFELVRIPINGSVTLSGNTFTYTPTTLAQQSASVGGATTDTFLIDATNGIYRSAVTTITVPISPVYTPSTPTAANVSTNAVTGVVTGTLSSTSPDGTNVSFSVTGSPSGGSVTLSGNTFTYTPTTAAQLTAGQSTTSVTDTFAVSATNLGGRTATGTITVPVAPAVLTLTSSIVTGTDDVPEGITISPDGKYVYAATINQDTQAHPVVVIDTATASIVANIGQEPISQDGWSDGQAIAISPDGQTLYLTNNTPTPGVVKVINTATGAVTNNIAVGNNPSDGIALSPNGAALYVYNAGSTTVSVINTQNGTVTATIAVGGTPGGIAVTPNGRYVFVGGSGTTSVIDTTTDSVVATIPFGGYGVAVSPNGQYAYVQGAVINTSTLVATPANIGGWAETLSPDGSVLYATDGPSTGLQAFSTATNTLITSVGVGSFTALNSLTMSPDGTRIYDSAYDNGQTEGEIDVISVTAPNTATG